MKKIIKNEKGLTLVEILAALVILGIVLVSFMSFFTQSAKFTAHNSEKLTNVQVAEDVIAEVRPLKFKTVSNTNNTINWDELSKQLTPLGYKKLTTIANTYETEKYTPYKVVIKIVEGPSGLEKQLKKAIVTVNSPAGKGINNPNFITEMYFEVSP